MGRREGLFRGSEFPRLMVLLGLAGVGWLWFFLNVGNRAAPPPPPPRVADAPPPTPPDDGPEFQGLRDRTALTPRDNPAYVKLLERARSTPPQELAAKARRDVLFTQLLERPELYRGVPIHIDGKARRVLSYDVSPAFSPKRRLYEAWTVTPDSQSYPYCLVFEDPPKDLAAGPDVIEHVAFDGYFLKLMAYQSEIDLKKEVYRAAPVLVGRIVKYADARSVPILPKGWDRGSGKIVAALVVLSLLGLLRVVSLFRRQMRPTRRPPSTLMPTDQIEPEALSEWLGGSAREEPEDRKDSGGDAWRE